PHAVAARLAPAPRAPRRDGPRGGARGARRGHLDDLDAAGGRVTNSLRSEHPAAFLRCRCRIAAMQHINVIHPENQAESQSRTAISGEEAPSKLGISGASPWTSLVS